MWTTYSLPIPRILNISKLPKRLNYTWWILHRALLLTLELAWIKPQNYALLLKNLALWQSLRTSANKRGLCRPQKQLQPCVKPTLSKSRKASSTKITIALSNFTRTTTIFQLTCNNWSSKVWAATKRNWSSSWTWLTWTIWPLTPKELSLMWMYFLWPRIQEKRGRLGKREFNRCARGRVSRKLMRA